MTVFDDAMADALAEVEQAAHVPDLLDLDFGSDLSCDEDLRSDFGELDADDPLLVAESSYRRLCTERGTLDDDADYGIDLRRWLHLPMTQRQLRENEGQVNAELRKDDRVESLVVSLVRVGANELELRIQGETATGAFTLTLAVTSAEVLLKELRASPG